MSNALIYSPSLHGHRQIYAYVLASILKELGFNIFVAGDLKQEMSDSTYIEILKNDKNIILIDTSTYPQQGLKITNEEFITMQDKFDINLTIFTEADFHINLFSSQIGNKKNKLRGRKIGIFLRPFYFYTKKSLLNKLRYIKHLPSRWKTDDSFFHEHLIKRFRLLDCALYIDENFVSHHTRYQWLPDVFQRYAETLVANKTKDQRHWIDKLNAFNEENAGRFVFLYFGTAQRRRGYDSLLKMAFETNGSFIHCGLNDPAEKFEFDIQELKERLNEEGRILETNEYISDPVCIELFFRSASHLILPYRNFLGSSGIMLQALDYGIPVLVPDEGVMGYRVKKYNLGLTYNKSVSLSDQFIKFKNTNTDSFNKHIAQYMKFQTCDQLKKSLVKAFVGSDQTIPCP